MMPGDEAEEGRIEEETRTEDRPRRTGPGVPRPEAAERHGRAATEQHEVGTRHGEARAMPATEIPAADADVANRPGVPKKAEPEDDAGAHWATPERQPVGRRHLRRKGLDELTPVFGTAQPPRGLSGAMRSAAYSVPEHRARHWALMLAADRMDVLENRVGEALGGALRSAGLSGLAGTAERQPFVFVAGAAAAGWLVGRMVR